MVHLIANFNFTICVYFVQDMIIFYMCIQMSFVIFNLMFLSRVAFILRKKKYKYRQVFFSIIIGQYDFFTLMNQEKQLGLTVQVTLNIFYSIHYRLIL